MGFLKLIGAVSAAEHQQRIDLAVARLESALVSKDETIERILTERDDANRRAIEVDAKFKRAVKDLAAAQDELTAHKDGIAVLKEMTAQDAETIAALRPDAQKWRDRAARELQRGQAKRDAKAPTKAVAAKGKK